MSPQPSNENFLHGRQNNSAKSGGNWLITFADLLSLMLTFFVLLYSMSSVSKSEFTEMSDSLQQRLNPMAIKEPEVTFTATRAVPKIESNIGEDLDYLYGVVKEKTAGPLAKTITIKRTKNNVTVSLSSDLLFTLGSSDLQEKGLPTLMKISDIVATLPNKVDVIGHTDPSPIHSDRHPSNWELSLARAQMVSKFIIESGYEYPLNISGMGASRFRENFRGINNGQTRKSARRVDIIIRNTMARDF